MKVLIISHEYPPYYGGGAYITYNLVEQLKKRNFQIHLLVKGFFHNQNNSSVSFYPVKPIMQKSKFKGELLPIIYFILKGLSIGKRILEKEKPDIVNAHFSFPSGLIPALLLRNKKTKFVISAMGADIYDNTRKLVPSQNFLLKKVNRWILNKASLIITLSSDIKYKIEDIYQIKKEIKIIPPGIIWRDIPKKERSFFHIDDKDFILITACRLVKRKRIEDLIYAMNYLEERFKLIIIGEGPQKGKIENLIKKLGIENRVILKGYVSEEEKYSLFSVSDAFIMVSDYEAFGIVYLEAMMAGLPVIAGDNGGTKDFIKEDNGFLVSPGDISQIVKIVNELKRDRNKKLKIGEHNKQYVKDNYNIEIFGEKYAETFWGLGSL